MNAPLYNEINSLAIDFVNASTAEDETAMASVYDVLVRLCRSHENTENDHPLQWEALGDFSDEFQSVVDAYEKGLACSIRLGLTEYSASISLALAEAYFEQNRKSKAKALIIDAKGFAEAITDIELKDAIDAFSRQL